MTPPESPLETIAETLAIEDRGEDRFEAVLHGFGGKTLGIAAHALARSCPGRELSMFHGTFLRGVDGEGPVEIEVERLREGRLLAHRRAALRRDGRLLFEATGTFVAPGDGIGFQQSGHDPGLPEPETLPTDREVAEREGVEFWEGCLEFRWIGSCQPNPGAGEGSRWSVWVKPRLPLADDPALRAGALAFLCDIHLDYAVRRRLGPGFTRDRFVSLEQSLWVHAPRPWDDWWLMTSDADVAQSGRALTWRRVFDREGRHLASMAQHSLLRGEAPQASSPGEDLG